MKITKHSVAIIEPSEILAAGLCAVINQSPDFQVTQRISGTGLYQELPELYPHTEIVILNPSLVPGGRKGGVRALFPGLHPIALLYSYLDRELLQQFQETIEICDKPAKILHKLAAVIEQSCHDQFASEAGELSDREREILVAVAKGLMNKEIADRCNISIHTVISHRKNISRKTGIKSVSGFVVYALLNNLIEEYEIQ